MSQPIETPIERLISYTTVTSDIATEDDLKQCAHLFSNHYGVWGDEVKSPLKPGTNVKMSPQRLREHYLFNKDCIVTMAKVNNQVIGQAFSVKIDIPKCGEVRWITQLVVSAGFRGRDIAQTLIHNSLGTKWNVAGLVSSHPYAVYALEKACGLRCDPRKISIYAEILLGRCNIPYLDEATIECDETRSLINTSFFVNHKDVLPILEEQVKSGKWRLGSVLKDGYEFFAFVFK